jgi:hypothetical protein
MCSASRSGHLCQKNAASTLARKQVASAHTVVLENFQELNLGVLCPHIQTIQNVLKFRYESCDLYIQPAIGLSVISQ